MSRSRASSMSLRGRFVPSDSWRPSPGMPPISSYGPTRSRLVMQSCGDANAEWKVAVRQEILCYEMADDFVELYRGYTENRKTSGRMPANQLLARNIKRLRFQHSMSQDHLAANSGVDKTWVNGDGTRPGKCDGCAARTTCPGLEGRDGRIVQAGRRPGGASNPSPASKTALAKMRQLRLSNGGYGTTSCGMRRGDAFGNSLCVHATIPACPLTHSRPIHKHVNRMTLRGVGRLD